MEIILAVLPWLALLACPAMMLWMMRGMGGGACHQPQKATSGADNSAVQASLHPNEEIRALKERIARLEAERDEARNWSGPGERLAQPTRGVSSQAEGGL